MEIKYLHSLSDCHTLCPTFQIACVKNQTAAECSCGCLTMTSLFLLIVFCSVASLTELDLLKMTWLTGNSWQITRLLMHKGRQLQFKSESCLRLETQWGLNERFLPPVFLCTSKWHGVNLIYAMFWEHATWWPSLPKKATLSLPYKHIHHWTECLSHIPVSLRFSRCFWAHVVYWHASRTSPNLSRTEFLHCCIV